MEWAAVGPYIVAQILGGTVGAALLFAIASGKDGFNAVESGFATNGWGERSPDRYGFLAAVLVELVLIAVFEPRRRERRGARPGVDVPPGAGHRRDDRRRHLREAFHRAVKLHPAASRKRMDR